MVSSKQFYSNTKITNYEILKIILMTISLIAPIRFIIFLITTLLNALSMYIIYYNHNSKDNTIGNISKTRRKFIYIPQFLARLSLFIIGYYWIKEHYDENINSLEDINEPNIIISNHVSFLDAYYFTYKCTYNTLINYRFKNIPFIGKCMEKFGAIFVGDKKMDKQEIYNSIDKITHSTNLNRPLLIFPEGGTKNNNYLYNFQLGAFRPLVPLRPVLLDYNNKYCDASWAYSHNPAITLYLLCCQFYNNLEVTYLKKLVPDNKDIIKYKEEAENLYISKGLIKTNLGVSDNIFFGKLFSENPKMAHYAYEHYLDKSVSEKNREVLIDEIRKAYYYFNLYQ